LLGVPMIPMLVAYAVTDPFKVLRHRDDFYRNDDPVHMNRDYASMELFLQNYERERYDTLILGNSRTTAFRSASVKRWLGEECRPFHLDASSESLIGLYSKGKFFERRGLRFANVLVVLDSSVLSNVGAAPTVATAQHPLLSGGGWLRFQAIF